MIVNNTNYLEQIYDAIKDYEDVGIFNDLIEGDIENLTSSEPVTIRAGGFSNYNNLIIVNLSNVTSIERATFECCTRLTTVNLPSVISIRNSAFAFCYSLTSVNLPNVVSIEGWGFMFCSSLTTIDLPNITSIGEFAFSDCEALTSVIIRTNTLCILDYDDAFSYTPIALGTGHIYVPKALIEDYKVASNWSKYTSQFRALEDYTVDGTTTGELDPNKI